MSANAFFRHGAELALMLNDRELVRFAAARASGTKPRVPALAEIE